MNIELIIMIAQTALAILQKQNIGGGGVELADSLLDIIAKAKRAYEDETGQPLDVNKIKPFEPIS